MLPLLSKPLIHNIVDEITSSGISAIIFVIAHGKESIVDYFKPAPELQAYLEKKKDKEGLEKLQTIPGGARFSQVYQCAPLGLGHAVVAARDAVGNQPFAVILPDDIIDSEWPVLSQMLDVYQKYPGNILLVEECLAEETTRYGIVDAETIGKGVYRVKNLVEKPQPKDAPSHLGIVGRYILMPEIFEAIDKTQPGKGGEIQLTDAIKLLLKTQPVFACEFEGTRYDTGTPEGWLRANNAWAEKESK
jgi:UTP--glucose-1-phosphate uridylyltransferase